MSLAKRPSHHRDHTEGTHSVPLAKRPSHQRDHTEGNDCVPSPNANHITETTPSVLTVSPCQTPITSQRPHRGYSQCPSANAHHITETTPRVLTVSPRQTPITSQRPHRGYSLCPLAKRPSHHRDHTEGTHCVPSANAHHITETTPRVLTVSPRQTPITSHTK